MRNLGPRIARLEQFVGEVHLPNGGIVIVVVENGAGDNEKAAALQRKLSEPEYAALAPGQRRKLIDVYLTELHLGVL